MKNYFLILAVFLSSALFGASGAQAGYACRTADGQTSLILNFGFPSVSGSVESSTIFLYYQVAYNYEVSKLEIAKEQDGQAVLEKTWTGYRGLLWAPTSEANQTWSFELSLASGQLVVTDWTGKAFDFVVTCVPQVDYRRQ